MVRFRVLVLAVCLMGMGVAGCQCGCRTPAGEAVVAADSWVRTDLYFGMTRRDSSVISEGEFQGFVDREITPRFPDGMTVTAAGGQYLDSKHVLHREGSRVLTVLCPKKDAAASDRKFKEIAAAYCKAFDQESVLRTDMAAKADFVTGP